MIKISSKNFLFMLVAIAFLILLNFFFFYPINSLFFRLGLLLSAIGSIFCVLILVWSKLVLRFFILGFIFLLLLLFVLPEKPYDSSRLREVYLKKLLEYQDTPYMWGGENHLGIDCSGLLRKSLIKATLIEGTKTINSLLLKKGVSQWWNDRTAKMLGMSYRGETVNVLFANSINELDHRKIISGDMAVTKSGVHVLSYMGGNKWIQADPRQGKVVINDVSSSNIWFKTPVKIMRWVDLISVN